jgi:hypothetical protein
MFALVLQKVWKKTPCKNRQISTLDKAIDMKGTTFQESTYKTSVLFTK